MIGRSTLIILLSLFSIVTWAKTKDTGLKDLYFGEALFYAHQEEYFEAISRLDTELNQYYGLDEPDLNSLYHHIGEAEFSVGDFELYYRMHNRASRAIKAVIEGDVEEPVRNEAIYRLAKIYYQKQQPKEALATINKLKGRVPDKIRYEEPFLRAQIYIATGKFTEAITLLKSIENTKNMKGFAGYNLAVALFRDGKEKEGILQLHKVGKLNVSSEAAMSMRDKANLVLGYRLLEAKKPAMAKTYLDQVRLKGPFSNKALLGSGWAAAAMGKYPKALAPWSLLSKRNVTNRAVQEVLLGVPYAYSKVNVHGKAAILYGKALEAYNREIDSLDRSIKSIREGKFLEAVIREEYKKDANWLINLRNLPNTPETHYLMQMMASHDFQESLKNYFDLAELKRKMLHWNSHLNSFEEMIHIRAKYYEPILPEIDSQFRALDSKMKLRLAQRDHIDKRLKNMLVAPRPDYLLTVDERITLHELAKEEVHLKKTGRLDADTRHRIERLRGIIHWNMTMEYADRFSKAHANLRSLDEHVKKLQQIYASFVRVRQAATQSFKGYDEPIQHLRIKIRMAQEKIRMLMARQGNLLESMAISELERRRQRLEQFQVKARFAMADSYDRATKAQHETEAEKEKRILEEAKADKNKQKPSSNDAEKKK